ncbi:MAG: exosortase/archaeosortase family protein [bacterium]|nr:exosortase/archaeosortase family protein [bacterium]
MSRGAIRETALAAVVTAVIAAGPLTPNEWGPSILIGLAVAGAILGYRLWLRPVAATDAGEQEDLAVLPRQFLDGLLWASLVPLWFLAFAPTLRWLWWEWTRSVWVNDHGIFMPFIIGYLIWRILGRDSDEPGEGSAWGFAFLGAGLLLSLIDSMAATRYLGMAGLLLTLPGISLLLLGLRRTRQLGVPWALSLLMVPVPFTLSTHLYLRQITASGVEPLIRMLGVPVLRDETVLRLSSGTFVVADACSGFSTLYASLAVAMVLAFMTRSIPRRIALLLAAPLLAIAANTVRVLSLVLIAHFVGRWTLDTPIHEATGVVAFFIVLIGMFTLARERPTEDVS